MKIRLWLGSNNCKVKTDLALIIQSLNKHRNHWRSQDLDSNVNMVSGIHTSSVFFPIVKFVMNLALQCNSTNGEYYHVCSLVSSRQLPFTVFIYFCLLQPKLEDEEGWKKFCLGERVYSEIDAESDHENLGIDYIKVSIRELIFNCYFHKQLPETMLLFIITC